MLSMKLMAGENFPQMTVAKLGGGELELASAASGFDWRMVVVYRGKHCPLCTQYLEKLNKLLPRFHTLGIDVVAVSADTAERAEDQMQLINPVFDIGYGLSIDQMKALKLYISKPRSPQEAEHPFAEPGLFIINEEGKLQVVDISNTPFTRPELEALLMGLTFIRDPENNYPIRGTYA